MLVNQEGMAVNVPSFSSCGSVKDSIEPSIAFQQAVKVCSAYRFPGNFFR